MLVIGGGILGVLVGGFTARKRGGSTADILQYAAGFGIADPYGDAAAGAGQTGPVGAESSETGKR